MRILQWLKDNVAIILSVIIILLISTLALIKSVYNYQKSNKYEVYEEMNVLRYHSTKYNLVEEVDKYIKSVAPQSYLNGVAIVDACIENDIDICFVLAQGKIESMFGTKGLARKTNSVWNVYAFDGYSYDQIHQDGKYRTPDESIIPYIHLLKNKYMVDGKTELDMMSNFSDKDGHKYSSTTTYEDTLTKQYSYIKNNTKIDSLTFELRRYAIILGY